eukprot:INCI9289.1.p1 GENE.INCI9289.1~~INCI9289.1.p1  ORF type:complete len:411 (-),score=90.06 INCI9289.1:198-1430(-)
MENVSLREKDVNLVARRGTPARMLSRRCSIGATNHRDVESEIFRQTSVSEMTKAWEGTNAQLQERTEEAKMAAHYGSRLLQKIDALENEVAALREQKLAAVQESETLRKKVEQLSKTNTTILAECQKSMDGVQEQLRLSEVARKKEVERRQQAETKVEQLLQQITELQATSQKLENAERQSATDSRTIAELQQEVGKLVAREAGLRNAAESSASAAQRKQEKLMRLTGLLSDVKSELASTKDSLSKAIVEKNDTEANFQARLEYECAQKARTQLELDRANLEIAELEERVSEVQQAHEEEKERHEVSLKEEAAKIRVEESQAMKARTAEERRRCQEEVMRDFFFMLVMSIKVKLQREILAGKVVDRSATDLYNAMKVLCQKCGRCRRSFVRRTPSHDGQCLVPDTYHSRS